MDWLMKHVFLMILNQELLNSAKIRLLDVKNIKLVIIVSPRNWKLSNKKSSTMDQSSPSFQSIEISSFIKRDSIKFIQETKNSQLAKPSKSSVGTSLMVKLVGLLKIVGEKIGDKMELRTFLL